MRSLLKFLSGVITITLSGTALAGPISFDLTDPDTRNDIFNSTYAKQYNYEVDELGLSVTGWSYNNDKKIVQDWVGSWDGLGVEKTNSPNHAMDNENGDFDMLLLAFDDLVALTSIDLGWISGDSDMSIMAFNGDTFNSSSFSGKKWQALLGNGWQSAGNYYNVDYGPNSGAINPGGIVSQYWLIGAYNNNLGNDFTGPNRNKTTGNDYFKVKGVTVDKPVTVPEPATLLLFALGLLGLAGRRRLVK